DINGQKSKLGMRGPVGWPADAGEAIAEKDYHAQLLHFRFACSSKPVIEDFSINYDVFDELGDRHRAIADIEQEGKHLEIVFTQFEPDYLYDTAYQSDPLSPARGGPIHPGS